MATFYKVDCVNLVPVPTDEVRFHIHVSPEDHNGAPPARLFLDEESFLKALSKLGFKEGTPESILEILRHDESWTGRNIPLPDEIAAEFGWDPPKRNQ